MKTPPNHQIAKRAAEMRRTPTASEAQLWKHLRNRQLENAKFRRQVWIGPYIADFACLEHRLIIEADGSQHIDDAEYDHHRSVFLTQEGFRILRFWNNEILSNLDGVLELIREMLLTGHAPSPSHAARGPLPLPGRERAQ
jgi:very-short-patch-repair endonuclease